MEDKGCSREEVLSFLAGLRAEDVHHDHILSSMCTIPHPIAVAVHEMFSATNLEILVSIRELQRSRIC